MKNTTFNALIDRIPNGYISAAEPISNKFYKMLQTVAVRIYYVILRGREGMADIDNDSVDLYRGTDR